ncbi:hypothetical protein LIER_37497 [Lithospermum erythrorhizon]|uniref:Uncharacterized protein n=1 Tax=Lithospermum erythrorhizon TaxID=34254 RepID=A0AAV3PLI9_LITER
MRSKNSLVGSISFRIDPPQLLLLQSKFLRVVADSGAKLVQFLLHGPHLEALLGQCLVQDMTLSGQPRSLMRSLGTKTKVGHSLHHPLIKYGCKDVMHGPVRRRLWRQCPCHRPGRSRRRSGMRGTGILNPSQSFHPLRGWAFPSEGMLGTSHVEEL